MLTINTTVNGVHYFSYIYFLMPSNRVRHMLSQSINPARNRFFWICAVVTMASALTSAGFSVAALSSSGDAHTNAMYSVSRSLSLATGGILMVILRSRIGLMVVSFIMALVQAGDAIIGAINQDLIKTVGPAFLALVTVGALVLLGRDTSAARAGEAAPETTSRRDVDNVPDPSS